MTLLAHWPYRRLPLNSLIYLVKFKLKPKVDFGTYFEIALDKNRAYIDPDQPYTRSIPGAHMTPKPCDQHIVETLQLIRQMIELADKGDAHREDVGCGILFGVLRDSAYKLKQIAEDEKQNHIDKGWWQFD